jgi:DNA protecting protein DprA
VTIRALRRGAPGYPPMLEQVPDPPARLWLRGDAENEVLARPAVAIVGARACSGYGRSVARLLAAEAAAAGAVVVSGLARGVDGEAHRGALASGGITVAVLGCGVDRDYPAAHAQLARGIVDAGGLVVSEYEPRVEPAPWRFPARKRGRSAAMQIWLNHAVAGAVYVAKRIAGVVSVWSCAVPPCRPRLSQGEKCNARTGGPQLAYSVERWPECVARVTRQRTSHPRLCSEAALVSVRRRHLTRT